MQSLFQDHLRTRQECAAGILEATGFDALILDAGRAFGYHADDQHAPFKTTPHFAHWTPLGGEGHLLLVRPGERPLLLRVAPEDYWYEQAPLGSPFWAEGFDVVEVADVSEAWDALPACGRVAYVGDAPANASAQGLEQAQIQPSGVLSRLDWDRSFKTPYEVACLEEASVRGTCGHVAARACFEAGGSELDVHHAFVAAVGCTESDLPYPTIVGLNEKGAILHYTGKRTRKDGDVLLIDAGARHLGYCSDITRTWTRTSADETFAALAQGMDEMQQGLCADVAPGVDYGDIHAAAHAGVAQLLSGAGVLRVAADEALERGLSAPFFPHGVGHFLGLQVHDVAGHQAGPEGGSVPPPSAHPFLRTTRTIEPGMVFTIEPGLYFIEMLLRPFRAGSDADAFDWTLIDRLTPFGGIRVEDNILVTEDAGRNLTREAFSAG